MKKFKVYFSKSSHLPCVECDGDIYKAYGLKCDLPFIGQWYENESPSWALVGECNGVKIEDDTIIIH